MKKYHFLIVMGVLVIVASLAFGAAAQDDGEAPTPEEAIGEEPTFLTGLWNAWAESPHARFEDDAFRHWDGEEDEGLVSERCAACHTSTGYADYLGADGSEAGVVDAAVPIGEVITCDACHNRVSAHMTSVTFPSGVELTDLDDSARCMVCHQGRHSTVSVNADIEAAGVTEDLNAVSEDLGFLNIHYYAAAATLYGSEVAGGYEFDGMTYQSRFRHVDGYATCADCHNPHTLELAIEDCTTCHVDVETAEDLRDIRMAGSLIDFDGDGDIEEGIYYEIETLQGMLYEAIQAYAADVVGAPIIHAGNYPYWFNDTNGDGEAGEDEAVYPNAYANWTGRLVQTTYNYQVSLKDPGGYTHNAAYHIELLVDSIMVLNDEMGGAMDVSQLNRDAPGHFDSTGEAFRHWDEDGEVSASCAKCHSAEGLPFFIEHGVNISAEISDSLSCTTCHSSMGDEFGVYTLNEVEFPSGFTTSFGEEDPNNVCLNCHQGRESTTGLNSLLAGAEGGPDEVSDALRFRNPHYFAAGATKFGSDAAGGYEYDGKDYTAEYPHARGMTTCTDCHDTHVLETRIVECADCHEDQVTTAEDLVNIRLDEDEDPVDYDGDGDVEEGVYAEISALKTVLFDQIITYAAETAGAPILYDSHSYPYWFNDTNGNGEADEDEVNYGNGYASWTPNLVTGIYNYLFVDKDPGAYAHNPDYALQLLYDSIEALGGDVSSFNRAPVIEY